MTQYYIVEIQQYQNGEFGHLVHFAYDENPNQAFLKADSKFYEIVSAAAISELPTHSVIMFNTHGEALKNKSYSHPVQPQSE